MVLPNFLVVGAQRSGTTWLYKNLKSCDGIYLPEMRKEVHFFDKYYERGLEWYEKFFPTESEAKNYQCIGEITPIYLYDREVPERISQTLPDCKFIAILRNPIKRAYSSYCLKMQTRAYKKGFAEFLVDFPEAFKRGLYADQIERYIEHFGSDNLLILIFEEVMSDPQHGFGDIFDFLSLDSESAANIRTQDKVNSTFVAKNAQALAIVNKSINFLKHYDLDWLVKLAKSVGIRKSILGTAKLPPTIDHDIKQKLLDEYEESIQSLEKLIQKDLSIWRQ